MNELIKTRALNRIATHPDFNGEQGAHTLEGIGPVYVSANGDVYANGGNLGPIRDMAAELEAAEQANLERIAQDAREAAINAVAEAGRLLDAAHKAAVAAGLSPVAYNAYREASSMCADAGMHAASHGALKFRK